MSFEAVVEVMRHSQSRHGARLVLIVLAEHANDESVSYPAVKTISERARLSERAVQDALRKLVEDGEITALGQSEYGTTKYLLVGVQNLRGGAVYDAGGVQNDAQNAAQTAPEPTSEPTSITPGDNGQLFEHDPVKEVWEHYCNTVPGKTNSRLSQETRRLIKRALDERPIDQLKLAINGLASSPHHLGQNDTGTEYLHIKYAIGKVRVSEGIGDRVDLMASKAPKQSPSGEFTVDELLRTVPSDRHWIIRDNMSNVIAAIRRGARATLEEERLRHSPGVEPIINDGQFAGWRKVES